MLWIKNRFIIVLFLCNLGKSIIIIAKTHESISTDEFIIRITKELEL